MDDHSFPIPAPMANMIFGEHKDIFEESMVAFSQNGLVAEGTIQFNPLTRSCSIVKFSILQDRNDSKMTFSKLTDNNKSFKEGFTAMDHAYFEKKRDGAGNVQNFASSLWGSEKPMMEQPMSEERMYSNFFFESRREEREQIYIKRNELEQTVFEEKHIQRVTDTCAQRHNDFWSTESHDNRTKAVLPELPSERYERKTSKSELNILRDSSQSNLDVTSPLHKDNTKISKSEQHGDMLGNVSCQMNLDKTNTSISSSNGTEQNDIQESQSISVPEDKTLPISKTESSIQYPSEKASQELLLVPERNKFDKSNNPETLSPDSFEGKENVESDENWDLNKHMIPFDEKYPDLNTEESFYENVLFHGENEATRELFENVKMFADSNGFEMRDSSPTGNCMFQSVNDQLQINGDFRFDVYSLRHLAVSYLENHPTDSEGTHLECFLDEQWNTYLTRMAQQYEWGDHLVLKALCEVLQRNIVVINVQSDDKTSHHEFTPKSHDQYRNETLYLGHMGEFHYVSLRPKLWKQTWISAALRNKQQDKENVNPQHFYGSKIENQLICSLSEVDPKSQMPVPYITFAITQITERADLCYLKIPNMVIPRERYRISTAGGRSDGSEVFIMHKNEAKHIEEYSHRFSFECPVMIFYDKNSVICDGGTTPLPNEQMRAELGGSHPGYCSLRYFGKQELMMTAASEVKINGYPENHGRAIYGYHCTTWPICAKEWLTRKSDWPTVKLKEKIASLGCFVVKRSHAKSRAPEFEWQFIFNDAEKLLMREALTKNQWYVYGVFKSCLDYHSQHLRYKLGTVHIKSTFFFACEHINVDTFEESPGVCFLYLAGILLRNLREGNVPNYFIRENNMIDHFNNEDVNQLIQILEAIRYFPLQCLGFMMDQRGYHRSGLIDIIQKDSESYRRDMDVHKAFCHVFFPLLIRQARKKAKRKEYREAYEKICSARLHLVLAPQRKDGKPVFVPSLDILLKQTLENVDENTVRLVTREREKCKGNHSAVMKVKDLTDGKDVGGIGELPVASYIVGNTLEEAGLLNKYGVVFHNTEHNYDDASTYYSFALDRLEGAMVEKDALRGEKKVSTAGYLNEQKDYYELALLCFKNLLHTRKLEKLQPRMPYLEKVCIRGRYTELVDFVMEAWEKLGYPDNAAKFHSSFLEHLSNTTK